MGIVLVAALLSSAITSLFCLQIFRNLVRASMVFLALTGIDHSHPGTWMVQMRLLFIKEGQHHLLYHCGQDIGLDRPSLPFSSHCLLCWLVSRVLRDTADSLIMTIISNMNKEQQPSMARKSLHILLAPSSYPHSAVWVHILLTSWTGSVPCGERCEWF